MPVVSLSANGTAPPDAQLFRDVNDLARHTGWLHAPLLDYAQYGLAVFALLLLAGWWIARRRGDSQAMAAALWAPVGTLLAVAVNQPIVNAVREARPYTTLPHILVLVDRSSDFSFPSDHATMAGAVLAGVFLVSSRLGVIAALAALGMAFSRVYIGAHYPHDVLAGLLLGAAVSLLGYSLGRRVLAGVVVWLERTALRPLLTAAPAADAAPALNGRPGGERR